MFNEARKWESFISEEYTRDKFGTDMSIPGKLQVHTSDARTGELVTDKDDNQ